MADSILFIGSKHFGLECLKAVCRSASAAQVVVATLPEGNDERDIPHDFEAFCRERHLALHMLDQGKDLHKLVEELRPDLCVVVGWYRIIPERTLSIPSKGFVGIHASLLPKYRGGAPLVWAMINGEKETGATLFRFDAGMDSGDIIGQERFSIEANDTITEVVAKAETAGIAIMEKHVANLLDGSARPTKQRHEDATYCAQRKSADGRIDWSLDADCINDFIRAQTRPYPGAFFLDPKGCEVRIWRAAPFPSPCMGTPGQVMRIDDDMVVCCGVGAISILEVQQEGGVPCPPETVIKQGDRLS